MTTRHDQLMKELIATFPAQFLLLAAPGVAEGIELQKVAFEPEEHYPGGPSGRERRPDLVARVRHTDLEDAEPDEVLLHAEIELEFRNRTAPRLLRYHRGLSLKYELPVHTIVLYLRGGPEGPQAQIYEERSLGRTVSTLGYYSLRLSRLPATDFLERPEPLAWAFAALMRRAKGQSRPQLGLLCLRRIAEAPRLSYGERRLLYSCVVAYAARDDREAREFDRILDQVDDEEIRTMTTSLLDLWRTRGLKEGREKGLEEGREKGLKKGLKKGLEQGRTTGYREMLLHLLADRFGSLSSEVEQQVEAIASAEELTQLAMRLQRADSLEDLGLA